MMPGGIQKQGWLFTAKAKAKNLLTYIYAVIN